MADLCLPLSAGHQLRERRAALETSRGDAHKSGVSIQHATNTPTRAFLCAGTPRTLGAPEPYKDLLKEFADLLSYLLVNVDKALIVRDFNIHVDNINDVLGLAFTDLINYFGV